MDVKWVEKFEHRVLITRFDQLSSAGAFTGGFHGGPSEEWLATLRTMLKFDGDLPWEAVRNIIEAGANDAIKDGLVTKDSLIHSIRGRAKAYASLPSTSFMMRTSINIHAGIKIAPITVGDSTIRFGGNVPAKARAARNKIFSQSRNLFKVEEDPPMLPLLVIVQARSGEEATRKALDAVDLIRGIWNFGLNQGWRRTLAGPPQPANKLMLGPLHTWHKPSGELSTEAFSYEPHFRVPIQLEDVSKDSYSLLKWSYKLQRKLRNHNYRQVLENAIIRYARALDQDDFDAAVVKLWSLLEFLTDTGGSNYEALIRRSIFLHANREFAKLELEHLRRYRNNSVHTGQGGSDVEIEMYQIKRYVEDALRFHIGNAFNFDSISAACSFLDLPADMQKLNNEIARRKDALKFLS